MTVTLDLSTLLSSTSPEDAPLRRTLASLSLAVAKSKRCVVVTGAGISCSCGIPDFRSSDGLYNLVKSRYPDAVLKGRDLFDSSLFRNPTSTQLFYTFMAELKSSIDSASPSPTHHFIKSLDTKGKLLRSYTQNIDGLEARVGIPCGSHSTGTKGKRKTKDMKNVQLHGNIHMVRCTLCSAQLEFAAEYMEAFMRGEAPDCPECTSRCKARVARSARAVAIGTLRPAIVLYDEHHPLGDEIGKMQTSDMARNPDLLIIMGTSLKVHGLKRLVKDFAGVIHSLSSSQEGTPRNKSPTVPLRKVIFVNRTPPPAEWHGIIDYHIQGETDMWVEKVVDEWKKLRPADWEIQTTLDDPAKSLSDFKVVKPTVVAAKTTKKKPKKSVEDAENIPLAISPPSSATLVDIMSSPTYSDAPVPLSPSKRQSNASHDDPHASPRKKRFGQNQKHVLSEASEDIVMGKGMLFGVKSSEKDHGTAFEVEVPVLVYQDKPKKALRATRPRKKVLGASAEIPIVVE